LDNAESAALIRRFIEAYVCADPDDFASYFTEDAQGGIRPGSLWWAALPWEIRNIVAGGNVVMTERIDNFQVGETRVSVPCMGAFELRDGKIAAWRDYWDLKYFEAQLPGKDGPI